MSVSSYGGGRFALDGVEPDETDILLGAFKGGHHWVRVVDGRIAHVPTYEKLPAPTSDQDVLPFWRPGGTEEAPVQLEMFHHAGNEDYSRHGSPSITIQSLCGYQYTAEYYAYQAKLLESYRFTCLRSRRGTSGQFWELWFLPGVWAAQGQLREAIVDSGKKHEKLKAQVAVEFLRQNASFGILDVSVQRLAQTIRD